MRARRHIPERERCANECGRSRMPGSNLCRACFRRSTASIAVPGRDVAAQPSKVAYGAKDGRNGYSEAEQDRDLAELGRCLVCDGIGENHTLDCDYWHFVDLGNEYFEEFQAMKGEIE